MVRYGAKESGFIVYRNQWWRLLSCIMLHGGIFHIIPNGAIQVCASVVIFIGNTVVCLVSCLIYLIFHPSAAVFTTIPCSCAWVAT